MGKIRNLINRIRYERDYSGNRQIMQLTYLFAAIFVGLIVYITIFIIKDSKTVINNPYNPREEIYAKKTVRGSIISRDGTVLAYTDTSGNTETRVYPYNEVFAHVIGYNTRGKQGLELSENFTLLNSDIAITDKLSNEAGGIKNPGNNIITTLDFNAQAAAFNALGTHRGAVVMIDAQTGEILALVSKPDFNPNTIDAQWEIITSDAADSRLLNRATSGLYPPGSTFKIVTALEYIVENGTIDNYDFDCTGSFEYDGSLINCYHKISHGEVDFGKSFAKSCNSSFANITTKLDKESFEDTCRKLLFNDDLPCPITCKKSFVPINKKSTSDELIQTGIGQGKTEITPYHMCLISAAIANDGVLMKPALVKQVISADGKPVSKPLTYAYKRLLKSRDAKMLTELMRDVITDGTGTRLKDTQGYTAYGKTGSAEYSSDKTASHAWFTGFAKTKKGEKIAISVLVEDGGSGGETAVPIAKKVFDAYIN